MKVIQIHGSADLRTISTQVKADPKAVAEVLDVLYSTPLITLNSERKAPPQATELPKDSLKYCNTNSLHGLRNINPATFQLDYNNVLQHVSATDHRIQALRSAIAAKESELIDAEH